MQPETTQCNTLQSNIMMQYNEPNAAQTSQEKEKKAWGGTPGISLRFNDGEQTMWCCNIIHFNSIKWNEGWQTMVINKLMANSHL